MRWRKHYNMHTNTNRNFSEMVRIPTNHFYLANRKVTIFFLFLILELRKVVTFAFYFLFAFIFKQGEKTGRRSRGRKKPNIN